VKRNTIFSSTSPSYGQGTSERGESLELKPTSRARRSHSLLPSIPDYVEERAADCEEPLIYSSEVTGAVAGVGRQLCSFNRATRVILFGPPGMGKSATLRNWSRQSPGPFWWVRADQTFSAFLGGTASNIAAVFAAAARSHAVLIFDDFDAFARRRDDPRESGEGRRVVTGLLAALDGSEDRVPVLAATNLPGVIDPAVLRRFSNLINFGQFDAESAARLLRQLFPLFDPDPEWLRIATRLSPAELTDIAKALGPEPAQETLLTALNRRVDALAAMRGEI